MAFVVTGISQDSDTAALEQALKAAGLSPEALDVITPEEADMPITGAAVGPDIITGGGLETGTGVPGLSGTGIPGITSAPSMIQADEKELIGDSLWDRLADLAIPDDELENYAEALENGRSIVAYHGDSKNVGKVEAVFVAAGLTKVKTF